MISENRSNQIQKKLLLWFQKNGRHHLPWRKSFSAYEVLVSEFMLQQTTVKTIIPRFQKWMELFPSIETLADASEERVLSAWQGLGYYARARRLHALSKIVQEKYAGVLPNNLEKLLALPGIGPYSANAILAFAFDQPVEVLDTNIIRILVRLNNIRERIDTKRGRSLLQEAARSLRPVEKGRSFTSALMDLGATICKALDPQCKSCPLSSECTAEDPLTLPYQEPRLAVIKKSEQRAFYYRKNKVYLERSEGPHWRGLWILPRSSTPQDSSTMTASLLYPITRYRVTMELYSLRGPIPPSLHPFAEEELKSIAIPSPHRRALNLLLKKDHSSEKTPKKNSLWNK